MLALFHVFSAEISLDTNPFDINPLIQEKLVQLVGNKVDIHKFMELCICFSAIAKETGVDSAQESFQTMYDLSEGEPNSPKWLMAAHLIDAVESSPIKSKIISFIKKLNSEDKNQIIMDILSLQANFNMCLNDSLGESLFNEALSEEELKALASPFIEKYQNDLTSYFENVVHLINNTSHQKIVMLFVSCIAGLDITKRADFVEKCLLHQDATEIPDFVLEFLEARKGSIVNKFIQAGVHAGMSPESLVDYTFSAANPFYPAEENIQNNSEIQESLIDVRSFILSNFAKLQDGYDYLSDLNARIEALPNSVTQINMRIIRNKRFDPCAILQGVGGRIPNYLHALMGLTKHCDEHFAGYSLEQMLKKEAIDEKEFQKTHYYTPTEALILLKRIIDGQENIFEMHPLAKTS